MVKKDWFVQRLSNFIHEYTLYKKPENRESWLADLKRRDCIYGIGGFKLPFLIIKATSLKHG